MNQIREVKFKDTEDMVYLVISSSSFSLSHLVLFILHASFSWDYFSSPILYLVNFLCPIPFLFLDLYLPLSLYHFPISQVFYLCSITVFFAASFQLSCAPSPSLLPVLLLSFYVLWFYPSSSTCFPLFLFFNLQSHPPRISSSLCLPFHSSAGYLRSSAERRRLPDP